MDIRVYEASDMLKEQEKQYNRDMWKYGMAWWGITLGAGYFGYKYPTMSAGKSLLLLTATVLGTGYTTFAFLGTWVAKGKMPMGAYDYLDMQDRMHNRPY